MGLGAPPDPAAEAPAGEAIGKFLRALRSEFGWVVVDASVDYSDPRWCASTCPTRSAW